jgi:hypothetical protein
VTPKYVPVIVLNASFNKSSSCHPVPRYTAFKNSRCGIPAFFDFFPEIPGLHDKLEIGCSFLIKYTFGHLNIKIPQTEDPESGCRGKSRIATK